jgi:two-component system phosphate regulon sensor histidine kinase PhoR
MGALLLLVLPLFAAAWAFGNYAAANERSRTDARLRASLRAAQSEYALVVDDAQLHAIQLASQPRVQRALRDRDHRALVKLRGANPDVQFLVGERQEPRRQGSVQRSIAVVSGDRVVGSIVADVTLARPTLVRIAREAGLKDQDEIAAAVRRNRVIAASAPIASAPTEIDEEPNTVTVGDDKFRGIAGDVAPGTRLAVLAPNDAVEDAAASIRGRILAIGLLVLAGVLVIAYLLAPLLARTRVVQQQRAVAERVLEHVADGVLLLDPHEIVRFWNQAAEAITGLPAKKVLGRRADKAIPGWQAAAQRVPVGDARGRSVKSATVPLDVGDEEELWVDASGVRFADGTVYTFRDITEDERLDQAKTDFVATVSHELRTPLASVYGAAVTLQERFGVLAPERRGQLLELLAEQANRLSTIIDELLLASKLAGRIDSGPLEFDHERFDADEVARVVVQAAQLHAPPGIEIELSTPPWLPHATGDSDKVAQVLTNLVENAVKYSPGGGRVNVVLEQEGDRIRFAVTDPGLGIPLDEQERIFQKFYRLDPNLTRGIGGTGLGLYICRELMRRMGSDIYVDSAPGVGSTFWFELPAAAPVDRVAEPVGSA